MTIPQPHREIINRELERFVSSYIQSRWRSRWNHILIESPEKGRRELHKFSRHLDAKRCCALDTASLLRSISRYGIDHSEVVCFDARSAARVAAPAQVLEMVLPIPDDMIVIFPASGRAVVFSHERGGWMCK